MTKTTIRTVALTVALMFGAATVLPLTASAQGTAPAPSTAMPKKHHAMHHHMRHHHAGGSAMVKGLQESLNKEGASLTVDGVMGSKTKTALKSFQQAHGLKATGRLDKATRAALKS